ncbi:hypothetical protein F4825DRAFT_456113 [Nemania diffusa]|nr:hypothetical protein F4825DRAFT_456113 [Nemania diffusa]
MEIVGTLAAATQLFGMFVNTLESLAQLHDLVKHLPGKYRRWDSELTMLRDTVNSILHNPALQSAGVSRVIGHMRPKIETLVLLCSKHASWPESKSLKRVLTTLSARTVEPRIVQGFESLEQDKTTLILAIHVCVVSNPMETVESLRRAAGEMPERQAAHQEMPFTPQYYNAGGFGTEQQGDSQRSRFTKIDVEGSGNIFGTSKGEGGDYEDIRIRGSNSFFGHHEEAVILMALQLRESNGTKRGRNSKRAGVFKQASSVRSRAVSSSRSSTKKASSPEYSTEKPSSKPSTRKNSAKNGLVSAAPGRKAHENGSDKMDWVA